MENIFLTGKFDTQIQICPKEYIFINGKNLFRVYTERGHKNHQFSSLNAQMKTEASKRDDMEAVGYILIFFLRGNLPWLYDPSNFVGIEKIKLESPTCFQTWIILFLLRFGVFQMTTDVIQMKVAHNFG